MGKCSFGEVFITEVSSRGIVQSGISPLGRCLSGNVSWGSVLGEVLVGELSSRETVLQSSNRTSIKIMVMAVITVSWKEEGNEYCQKIRYWCLRHVICKIALGTSKFDRFKYTAGWIVFKFNSQFKQDSCFYLNSYSASN